MLRKNRIMVLFLSLALCMGLLSGCAQKNAQASEEGVLSAEDQMILAGNSSENVTGDDSKPGEENAATYKVVCTIFPEYDWARELIGDQIDQYELTMLLDNGVDLHSYQPTAEDIAKIASCDLFIYVGGESDGWVEDALKEATNPNMQVINLLDVLGDTVKEEEVVEGMQGEEEEETGETEETEIEEPEYDEHVWLSLKNAEVLSGAISDALQKVDSQHADEYHANLLDYQQKLSELDTAYSDAVSAATQKTVVFGDRFPFRYLVDDYGLDYYAAFVGCSAETEASFETIIFLSGKMDELGLQHILTIEKSDQKIAKTIIGNTKAKNQDILTLNSMQSTTSEDMNSGATYVGIMQSNLEVLKTALE